VTFTAKDYRETFWSVNKKSKEIVVKEELFRLYRSQESPPVTGEG
jgi:hypothetical protein